MSLRTFSITIICTLGFVAIMPASQAMTSGCYGKNDLTKIAPVNYDHPLLDAVIKESEKAGEQDSKADACYRQASNLRALKKNGGLSELSDLEKMKLNYSIPVLCCPEKKAQ